MAFSEKIKKEIETYCNNHLATDLWYENEFYFIQNVGEYETFSVK